MSQTASGKSAVKTRCASLCAYCLGIVLNDLEVVALGNCHQLLIPAGSAVEVHRHDGFHCRSHQVLDERCVHVHGVGASIAQAWGHAVVADGEHRCHIGVGGYYHVVVVV